MLSNLQKKELHENLHVLSDTGQKCKNTRGDTYMYLQLYPRHFRISVRPLTFNLIFFIFPISFYGTFLYVTRFISMFLQIILYLPDTAADLRSRSQTELFVLMFVLSLYFSLIFPISFYWTSLIYMIIFIKKVADAELKLRWHCYAILSCSRSKQTFPHFLGAAAE